MNVKGKCFRIVKNLLAKSGMAPRRVIISVFIMSYEQRENARFINIRKVRLLWIRRKDKEYLQLLLLS